MGSSNKPIQTEDDADEYMKNRGGASADESAADGYMAARVKAAPALAPAVAAPAAPVVSVPETGRVAGLTMGAFRGAADVGNSLLKPVNFGPPAVNVPGLGSATNPFNREARAADLAGYERTYGDNGYATTGRIGTNLLLTAPPLMKAASAVRAIPQLGWLAGAGEAGSLPAVVQGGINALTGAAQGGAGAAMLLGGSNAPAGAQIGIGTGLGLLLGPFAPVVQKVGSKLADVTAPLWEPVAEAAKRVYRGARGLPNPLDEALAHGQNALGAAQTPGDPLEAEFRAHGLRLDQLPEQVRQRAAQEAADMLKATGKLDATQLVRKINLESLGLGTTDGIVTRDPVKWAAEQELAKGAGGETMMQRFTANNAKLRAHLADTADQFGGKANDTFDAGTSVVSFFKAKDQEVADEVSKAYTAVRKQLGDRPGIAFDELLERMAPLADETAGVPIVTAVKARMTRWGALTKDGEAGAEFTVKKAEELRKFIGQQGGDTKAEQRVRKELIDALDDSVTKSIGFDPFQTPRQMAKARFDANESSKIIAALDDAKANPDHFVDRYILSKTTTADDLGKFTQYLLQGTPAQKAAGQQVLNDLRQQVSRDIWKKSVVGGSPEEGLVSYPKMSQVLESIGPQKMRILFGDTIKNRYQSLVQAAHDIHVAPPKAPVNTSNTAVQAENRLMRGLSAVGDQGVGLFGMGTMLGDVGTGGLATTAAMAAKVAGARMTRRQLAREAAARDAEIATAMRGSSVPLSVAPENQLFGNLLVPTALSGRNALLNPSAPPQQ